MKNFILSLQFIFKPSYWIMNRDYSKVMDEFMNDLFDNYTFTDFNSYTARLSGIEIWITNRPYACMFPYSMMHTELSCRPSRLTIQKGIRKYKKELKKSCSIPDKETIIKQYINEKILRNEL